MCKNCYNTKDYNKRSNCTAIIKSLTDRRTGNQHPNSSNAKGDKFQKVTGKFYDSYNQWWTLVTKRSIKKDFDNLVFYCASKDGKTIERIYIFPRTEILKRQTITIVKNPSKGSLWYEQYRVTDEETIKKVNDIWKKILLTEMVVI